MSYKIKHFHVTLWVLCESWRLRTRKQLEPKNILKIQETQSRPFLWILHQNFYCDKNSIWIIGFWFSALYSVYVSLSTTLCFKGLRTFLKQSVAIQNSLWEEKNRRHEYKVNFSFRNDSGNEERRKKFPNKTTTRRNDNKMKREKLETKLTMNFLSHSRRPILAPFTSLNFEVFRPLSAHATDCQPRTLSVALINLRLCCLLLSFPWM